VSARAGGVVLGPSQESLESFQRDLTRELNLHGQKRSGDGGDRRRGFHADTTSEPSVVQMLGQVVVAIRELTDSVRESVSFRSVICPML
jgi:hypothetical protein